jgi:endonuclease YncB( thermonuclease family)
MMKMKGNQDVQKFSFDGFNTTARLSDVHDGDTVTVVADIGPFFDAPRPFEIQLTLRLDGIDAPEMTSRDVETKKKAEAVRYRILELLAPDLFASIPKVNDNYGHLTRMEMQALLNERAVPVYVSCRQFDKFGRTLAEVSSDIGGRTVNDILLAENLVKRYDGGTKS